MRRSDLLRKCDNRCKSELPSQACSEYEQFCSVVCKRGGNRCGFRLVAPTSAEVVENDNRNIALRCDLRHCDAAVVECGGRRGPGL